jgi:hypothetical protein
MKIWETLVGVRDDLPSLRQKWWHKLSIIFVFLTAIIAFFVAAALLIEPIKPTPQNVFSLSLITFAKGRPGQVSRLSDLGLLPGAIATLDGSDDLLPLTVAPPPENIRCEAPPRFKVRQTFVEKDPKMGAEVKYTTIPDRVGQPEGEPRFCAATPAYASLASDHVVSYRLNGAYRRWRSGAAAAKSLGVAAVWLVLCLNLYYRGIISIYAARRKKRIRNPNHSR